MKKALLFSSGITGIVVGVFALAYLTSAATTKYSFSGRGIAREHDFAGKCDELGDRKEADEHRKRVEDYLKQHYEVLLKNEK